MGGQVGGTVSTRCAVPGMFALAGLLAAAALCAALLSAGWCLWRHFTHLGRPEYQWALAALAHEKQLQSRRSASHAELALAASSMAAKTGNAWATAAAKAWDLVAVEELSREDNIGPATVEMLRGAGMRKARDVEGHWQLQSIPGIGPARAGHLRLAVVRCKAKAISGLLGATSGPGLEVRCQEEGLRAQYEALAENADTTATDKDMARLLPVFALARWYWWRVMLSTGSPPILPQGLVEFRPDASRPGRPSIPAPAPARPSPPSPALPIPAPVPPQPSEVRVSLPKAAPVPAPAPVPKAEPAIRPSPPSADEVFEITARLVATAGFADGRFVESEKQEAVAQLKALFGSLPRIAARIDPWVESAERESLDDLWMDIERLDMEQRRSAYRACCRVMDAAGTRNAREVQFLQDLQRGLGLAAAPAQARAEPVEPATMDVEAARTMLEIDPLSSIDIDLVRRQNRLLLERIEAVRPGTLGPQIEAMLKTRRELVSKAATRLAESLGQPLEAPAAREAASPDPRHNPDLDAALGL